MSVRTVGVLAAVAGVGIGTYLAVCRDYSAPPPSRSPATAVPAPPAALPAPVVLAGVVEVADLDPLLDPPVRPAGGVPFDEPPAPPKASPAPAVIPPAVD